MKSFLEQLTKEELEGLPQELLDQLISIPRHLKKISANMRGNGLRKNIDFEAAMTLSLPVLNQIQIMIGKGIPAFQIRKFLAKVFLRIKNKGFL